MSEPMLERIQTLTQRVDALEKSRRTGWWRDVTSVLAVIGISLGGTYYVSQRLDGAEAQLAGRIDVVDGRIDGIFPTLINIEHRLTALEEGQKQILELLRARQP